MQLGFFDIENRLGRLSKMGDALERINPIIDWEIFRPLIEHALQEARGKAKDPGGRPAFDCILMFKILFLQRLYHLSDDQTEYQINDRLSFMRFLGLGLGDKVPDAKTIWLFKDTLSKAGVMRQLFDRFGELLEDAHLITKTGTIVDATFVDAPRQHNTRKENKTIKEGGVPEEWQTEEMCHKLAQKDTDARWAKKNNEVHYSYKDHVKADADSAYSGKEEKSKIRVRIEHIFGFMTVSMHGITLKSIGRVRAEFQIGLTNLIYNICRFETLSRLKRAVD